MQALLPALVRHSEDFCQDVSHESVPASEGHNRRRPRGKRIRLTAGMDHEHVHGAGANAAFRAEHRHVRHRPATQPRDDKRPSGEVPAEHVPEL